MRVGILGGTGPQGRGLTRRFAAAGHTVVIGSRSAERAAEVAAGYADVGAVSGGTNADAAAADLVVVTVPYEGHAELLTGLRDALADKIVVDSVNPLGFDGQGPYALPVRAGSAAQEAQQILTASTVVAAFHHVSAVLLDDPAVTRIEGDVLVLGEDREAVRIVCELATAIPGARGLYAGRLRNAGQVEAFTANLIAINRRYKAHAGLSITDLPASS
ncbi:NADPH-dependent F420 reductase [uncultured Friedmanniella sp.]|uniref:NADPH-dependent F420 reductase n=1 Tax=uncultured Friedmanniella sp. TaxID=335381 RepID=UPI0035C94963